MRYLFFSILIVFSILAFFFSTRVFYNKNYKKKTFTAFSITSLGSGLWSLGYAFMLVLEDEQLFLLARASGIIGMILFLLSAQVLIGIISEYDKKGYMHFVVEGVFGVIIMWIILLPGAVTLNHTSNGIITVFNNSKVSLIYTLYTLVVAVIFIIISIKMTNKKNRTSVRKFGGRLLHVEAIIILGMIIDTVLPALGMNVNIPASTMLQFVGIEIIYRAVHKVDRNQINLMNMTGYIYKSLKSAVFVFDAENKLQISNVEAKRLFDFKNESEWQDHDFWKETFHIAAPEAVSESDKTVELDVVYDKGNINCHLYVDPIFDEYKDYLGYIVVVADMSQHTKYLRELEESRFEAMRANQAKSAFLANISHEIRTPMNAIMGFSKGALTEDFDPKVKEYFEDIYSSAETLFAVVNAVIDISNIESGKIQLDEEQYYSEKLLKEISLVTENKANKKNLQFELNVDENLPTCLYGDMAKVRSTLLNVLDNAVKFTENGSVKCEVHVLNLKKKQCKLRFDIIDTGCGILKEDVKLLLRSFERGELTSSTKKGGIGLGLSIAKGFLDIMGGTISIDSEIGKGTFVRIEIEQKVVNESNLGIDEVDDDWIIKNQKKFQDLRVLIVDENPINIKSFSSLLKLLELKGDDAFSGHVAVEYCKKNLYDVIFIDSGLSDMDSVKTMKQIRSIGNGYEADGKVRIISLIKDEKDDTDEIIENLGYDGYLCKPIDLVNLKNCLEKSIIE